MDYYSNMCRYDSFGRRLAVFGRVKERGAGEMIITIIRCSKKDQFSRKFAHTAYNQGVPKHDVHPEIIKLKLENVTTPKNEFIKFVNENYYRLMHISVPFKGRVMNMNLERSLKMDMHGRKAVNIKYLRK